MLRGIGVSMGILALFGSGSGARPEAGTPAPPFESRDQDGKLVKLSDFLGRSAVVLYFYPKDDTPGCTREACSLRDGMAELRAAGAVVLGVSTDGQASHKKFAEKYALPFSLLADPEGAIVRAYGVKWPLLGIARRTTFLIDRQGIVRKVLADVDCSRHHQQVLEALKSVN